MPSTLITVVVAGIGIILLVSAWENVSIGQTLNDIISGKLSPATTNQNAVTYSYTPISNAGANASVTGTGIQIM